MKKILFFVSAMLSLNSSAQIKANAGLDRRFCVSPRQGISLSPTSKSLGLNDTLGGYPAVVNGTPPFIYKWTTLNDVADRPQSEIDATAYLNAIAIAHPKVTKIPDIIKPFFLTIIDSLGNKARDTVYVSNSNFYLISSKFYKKPDDTLQIYQQFLFVNPSEQNSFWENKSFNQVTNSFEIKVWNKVTDSLKAWSTDNYGCKSDTNFITIVCKFGIGIQTIKENDLISNFHNPISSFSEFEFNPHRGIEEIILYSSLGEKLYSQKTTHRIDQFSKNLANGIYLIQIRTDKNFYYYRVLKE